MGVCGASGRALVPSHRPGNWDYFNPFSRAAVTTHPARLQKLHLCLHRGVAIPKKLPGKFWSASDTSGHWIYNLQDGDDESTHVETVDSRDVGQKHI